MKRCRPPAAATIDSPGCRCRWKVLESTICASVLRSCSALMPLTVAAVPTGMKRGVSTTPWGVWKRPCGPGYGGSDAAARIGTEQQCSTPTGSAISPYGEAQDGGSTQPLMLRWWPDLAGSWIFYTTLPLWPGVTPRFERIARFAPVIGVFIGGAQAGLWLLGRDLGMPSASCALLVLALGLWLTGGLHLDGVMETGDGLAAGPRCLAAMADSRIGASGLVAGLMVLLLKVGALLALAVLAPTVLIWSAVWGRVAPLLAIAWFPYLRAEGSGGFHRQHRQPLLQELLPAAAVLGLLVGLSLSPPGTRTVLAGVCGVIPTLLVPRLLGQRLGGHTGDSYGACVEWTEAFSLWSGWLMLRLLS